MRVVFDTNIYISAFAIPGGQAEDAYLKAIQTMLRLGSTENRPSALSL